MRYLLLLVSLFVLVACSSAKESEAVAELPAAKTVVPTWTPTPLPVATDTATPVPTLTPAPIPTSTPEPTLVPATLAQVEAAVDLPFRDEPSRDGPVRFAIYSSPLGGYIMVTLDPGLSSYGIGWSLLALGDQHSARKFKATFRTLSILLLDTNAAIEAIAFVDTCYSDSVIPAVSQIRDVKCESVLTDKTHLLIQYEYEPSLLIVYTETHQ